MGARGGKLGKQPAPPAQPGDFILSFPDLSPAFILRRNPYRDTSLLLDLFTREEGKITCVAKLSSNKGGRTRGLLEPFRLLDASWTGRGEVFTLMGVEEVRRYPLKQAGLIQAVYMNELLLRALWKQQPQADLFAAYQETLETLLTPPQDQTSLQQFEWKLLAVSGYVLNLHGDDVTGQGIDPERAYRFHPEQGLSPDGHEAKGVLVSGDLLIALREPGKLTTARQQALRRVLDHLFQMLLQGRILHARRLL